MITNKMIALAREYREYLIKHYYDLALQIDTLLSKENVTNNDIIHLFKSFESTVNKQSHIHFFSQHDKSSQIEKIEEICREFLTKAHALEEMERVVKQNMLVRENDNNTQSFMLHLSDEVLLNILSYLTYQELQRISLVSNRLMRLSQDDSLQPSKSDYAKLIGEKEFPLNGQSFPVYATKILSKNLYASSSADKTIRIWDLNSGECKKKLIGHKKIARVITALPRDQLASGSEDGTILIWDLKTGDCKHELRGSKEPIRALAISSNGLLASALKSSKDLAIQIWNLNTNKCVQELNSSYPIRTLLFLSNDQLMGATDYGVIDIWDLKTGNRVQELELRDDRYNRVHTKINTLELLPNDQLASGSDDGVIRIWNLHSGKCIQKLAHLSSVNALLRLPHKQLASEGNGLIRIWDLKTGQCVQQLKEKGEISDLALSNGEIIGVTQDKIKTWSFATLTFNRKVDFRVPKISP